MKRLLFLLALLLIPSVLGAGDETFLKLLANTDKCAPSSCFTDYLACADSNGQLDLASLNIKYQRSEALYDTDVNGVVTDVVVREKVGKSVPCQDAKNKTLLCTEYSFIETPVASVKLNPSECVPIRVKGSLKPNTVLDHVVELQTWKGKESFTQWVVWDATTITAYYQFNSSYVDGSGNANTLTGINSPVFNTTDKKTGTASWQRVSADAYANKSAPSGFPLGAHNFTVMAWIAQDAQPSASEDRAWGIGDTTNGANFKNIGLSYGDDAGTKQLRVGGRGFGISHNVALNTSVWYATTVTYNSDTQQIRIFLNGNQVTNSTLGTALDLCEGSSDGTCVIFIGAYTNQISIGNTVSQVDDFRLLNFVANDSQILNYFNNSNAWGLTSLDTPETPDTTAPLLSMNVSSPLSPQTYLLGRTYTFSINASDDVGVVNVTLQHDFTGSVINETVTLTNGLYNKTTELGAGTYSYQWFAFDLAGNKNASPVFSYTVVPANRSVNVSLNGVNGERYAFNGTNVLFNATSTTAVAGDVFRDGVLWLTGGLPLLNTSVYTLSDYTFVLVLNGSQNYTAQNVSRVLHVVFDQSSLDVYGVLTPLVCPTASLTSLLLYAFIWLLLLGFVFIGEFLDIRDEGKGIIMVLVGLGFLFHGATMLGCTIVIGLVEMLFAIMLWCIGAFRMWGR